MAKTSYFNDEFRRAFSTIGYLGALPFYLFLLLNWFGDLFSFQAYDTIWLFRFYSIAILAFMGGSLWSVAFSTRSNEESFEFRPMSLVLGSVFVVLMGFGVLLLKPSVGVFIAALLFLVLWQIELKTNLARLYPQWYWVLRTKLTMAVAMAHILLWVTLS